MAGGYFASTAEESTRIVCVYEIMFFNSPTITTQAYQFVGIDE